jgi:protein-tyrosine phosphatase
MEPAEQNQFRILTVSTTNTCRSPAMEMLLRCGLRGVTDIAIASVGTAADVGKPLDPIMAGLLEEGGLLIEGFRARQVHVRLLERADLILCATRRHRTDVMTMSPSSVRKTFALREISRLAPAIDQQSMPRPDSVAPSERIRSAMPLLRLERGVRVAKRPEDDDVEDPTGRSLEYHQKALDQMIPGVEALLGLT